MAIPWIRREKAPPLAVDLTVALRRVARSVVPPKRRALPERWWPGPGRRRPGLRRLGLGRTGPHRLGLGRTALPGRRRVWLRRVLAPVTVLAWLLCLAAGCAVVAGGAVVGLVVLGGRVAGSATTVDPAPVHLPPLTERSVVYGSDGSTIAVLQADSNRKPITLDQVAPVAVNAVIDTEDARFWEHGGVDRRGVARALAVDLKAGDTLQGGSSITQQLVKNTLLSSKRDLSRKVTEMVLANRLEHQLGRRGVLERYLNTIYFGEGAYGIEAAAETYFNVPAAKLDVPQAAMLAGLIQDPGGYDPIHHARAARLRRQTVLDMMVTHRHLTPEAAAAAAAVPVPTSPFIAPSGRDYATDAVKELLLADPRFGATVGERYQAVFTGGLQIHTTIDPSLQRQAQAAIAAGLPTGYHLTAAEISIDPATGAVRSVVGGPDFSSLQFDTALTGAGRQAGSSFKVFTLVAALEAGYSPDDMIDGSTPCSIPNPHGTPDPWMPDNFEGETFGWMSITDATVHSVNCAYARLAMDVGLARVAEVAHGMGITSHLNIVPSMTLGTNEVTPLQMASAYATLAADGAYHTPHLIASVTDSSGKVLFSHTDAPRQAIPPQIAREATQVLQQVVARGTGVAAAVRGHPVAGKTGTAENYHDAWFVGYSPQVATAVWMGNASGEVAMRNIRGINVVGGSFPARIWRAYMTVALAGLPAVSFVPPDASQMPPPVVLVDGQPRGQDQGTSLTVIAGGRKVVTRPTP